MKFKIEINCDMPIFKSEQIDTDNCILGHPLLDVLEDCISYIDSEIFSTVKEETLVICNSPIIDKDGKMIGFMELVK